MTPLPQSPLGTLTDSVSAAAVRALADGLLAHLRVPHRLVVECRGVSDLSGAACVELAGLIARATELGHELVLLNLSSSVVANVPARLAAELLPPELAVELCRFAAASQQPRNTPRPSLN